MISMAHISISFILHRNGKSSAASLTLIISNVFAMYKWRFTTKLTRRKEGAHSILKPLSLLINIIQITIRLRGVVFQVPPSTHPPSPHPHPYTNAQRGRGGNNETDRPTFWEISVWIWVCDLCFLLLKSLLHLIFFACFEETIHESQDFCFLLKRSG